MRIIPILGAAEILRQKYRGGIDPYFNYQKSKSFGSYQVRIQPYLANLYLFGQGVSSVPSGTAASLLTIPLKCLVHQAS